MPSPSLPRVAAPSPRLLRYLKKQNILFDPHFRPSGSISCPSRARRIQPLSTSHRDIKLLPAPRSKPIRHFEPPRTPSNFAGEPYQLNGSTTASLGLYSSPSHHRRRSSLGDSNKPALRRLFSSSNLSSIWNILGLGGAKGQPATATTSGLPPLASFLDDNHSPGRALKPSTEPRLRCTEFDENGNVTVVNGEFKKTELIAKYGLLPRDLRKIDSSLLPSILVRPSAILINLLHLRVLIKNDRVLVFDAYGSTDSYTQSVFMYDLEGKLRAGEARGSGALPYEFRALEAVLISVTTSLESEFEGVRDPVLRVLRELEEDIDRDKLRYLLIYSKKLGTFEQKARLVRDALEELLEADDDLAAMYLSEKAKGSERAEDDHDEAELLLESYHKVADEIVQAAENLVSNIRNTEEMCVFCVCAPATISNSNLQRARDPGRQPQLADATGAAVFDFHVRIRCWHVRGGAVRYEPEELHGRVQPGFLGRVGHIGSPECSRTDVWSCSLAQGAARLHLGRVPA